MQYEFHHLMLNFNFIAINVIAVPFLTFLPIFYFNGVENYEVST